MALLGIEIGGTKVVLCVGSGSGEPRESVRRAMAPTGSWRRDLDRLIEDAGQLLVRAGVDRPRAIGVSAPGPCDAASGIVSHPPNLPGWDEVPIVRALEAAFDGPVHLENDANAAARAEWRFGAGRGVRDLAYLTMATGVGGGMILDGRLTRGAFGGAGEIGHVPIGADGPECACGRTGCLEALCGGNAWQRHLQQATPEASEVWRRAGAREAIRPEHLVAAAHAGDAFACAEMARWTEHLGRGLAALILITEPARVVLGTIAVAAGEALCFGPLRDQLERVLWPHQKGRVEIVPALLGTEMPQYAGLAVALGDAAAWPPADAAPERP